MALVNNAPGTSNRIVRKEEVYELLRVIPAGRVSTYGDIARAIGHEGASRAIGAILNRNPYPIVVPCHRVVMWNGRLGGYANGVARKKELLMKEGIIFNDDIIVDFRNRRMSFQKRSYANNHEFSAKKPSEKRKKGKFKKIVNSY